MAEQEQERIFIPGMYVSKQSFGKNKGEIIKLNIKLEDFLEFAKQSANDRGYLNIDIKSSIKDRDKLYAELNTWQPASAGNPVDDSPEDDLDF